MGNLLPAAKNNKVFRHYRDTIHTVSAEHYQCELQSIHMGHYQRSPGVGETIPSVVHEDI